MAEGLRSARLKLERARQHLTTLGEETRLFVASEPYRTGVEFEELTGHHVVRIRYARPDLRIPARLGLIAGDIVHNLRCALDHLIWDLAGLGGGGNQETQFPLYDDARKYAQSEARLLHRVDRRDRVAVQALQPYHVRAALDAGQEIAPRDPLAPNVSLMLVGRLDNVDKHRVLPPITSVSPFRKPEFRGVKSAKGTYPADWIRLEDGAELYRITEMEMLPGRTEIKVVNDPVWTTLFGDADFTPASLWTDRAKGAASAADLRIALDHVLGIVDSFQSRFP